MTKRSEFSRRFAVRYHMRGDPSTVLRQGFAATVGGAVRSSVYRVFLQMYGSGSGATIYDRELEIDLLHVHMTGAEIHAGFTTQAMQMVEGLRPKLRRVK